MALKSQSCPCYRDFAVYSLVPVQEVPGLFEILLYKILEAPGTIHTEKTVMSHTAMNSSVKSDIADAQATICRTFTYADFAVLPLDVGESIA